MYLNFGPLGLVLLNVFGGWLVRGWDRIAQRYAGSLPTMIFYLVGLAAIYFLGRSFSVQTLYPLVFFAVAVYFLSHANRSNASSNEDTSSLHSGGL